ncbi:Site-specific recombinase XerC [Roseovarius nanhaiticus]|uniref:Site-specific recombinase XerC n=2 Tax=Roseovarius nanhaiticus TaxID=573024 RepID=A0A1N7FKT1_9RHOB|nr:Site-specific recombinase XerC [Roseovarius nanhaiticus]SIS00959.1 Site-specific recombinase XerC [Roseovarius nanhaiticus]
MIKEEFGTAEFWEHYHRLLKVRQGQPGKRTFETLILSYYESDAYRAKKPRTKADYRRYMEHIRKIWGEKDPAKIETQHIYQLHRANADSWRRANYLVQVMVVLMNHARLIGFLKKEDGNPARGIPLFKQPGDGWEPWPEEVRREFELIAPARARLVYELCVGTGQRIGDVITMRWDHFKDGYWDMTQGKGQKPMWIPLTARLTTYLATLEKKGLTVVTAAGGRPASYRAISQEMRKVKAAMQHPEAPTYVTHGLRKNATIELYLAGCDDEMVKAVTGHSGVEMLKKYGGRVRQKVLATRAQEARDRTEQNKPRT